MNDCLVQNHAVLLRYLAPNCREEVKAYLNKRSESPPIAAEKRKQGRVRARFYNNSAQPSPPPFARGHAARGHFLLQARKWPHE